MSIHPIIPIWIIIPIIFFIIITKQYKNYRIILIIILLFFINLRITITSTHTTNQNILIILDTTLSMNTEDCNNTSRLKQAKKDIIYIINKNPSFNYSIITYDNTTNIISPFTDDLNYLETNTKNIKTIDEVFARGSSLNTPLPVISNILKRHEVTVFYLTDGEDNQTISSKYSTISHHIKDGAVLGYGSTKGNYIKYNGEYIIDRNTNKKAKSYLNKKNLKRLAKYFNVDYIHMNKQKNIDYKLRQLSNNNKQQKETYFIFIIPLIILIIIEFKPDWSKKI